MSVIGLEAGCYTLPARKRASAFRRASQPAVGSKTLSLYGQKVVKDTKGASHVWAEDVSAALVAKQHPDGSWANTNRRYMENDPILVTSYSLIALAYCVKH